MMGGIIDGPRGNFRLIDRRNWLRLMGQTTLYPAELRSIKGRHLHHGSVNVAVIVQKLSTQRGKKAQYRMLGSAVCGLQRNAAIRQRRAYMHNGSAVPRKHTL